MCGFFCGPLHPVPMLRPPTLVARSHIGSSRPLPHRPVDEFPYDICVACVSGRLVDHVGEGSVQGEFVAPFTGYAADRVQGECVDRRVGVRADPRPDA